MKILLIGLVVLLAGCDQEKPEITKKDKSFCVNACVRQYLKGGGASAFLGAAVNVETGKGVNQILTYCENFYKDKECCREKTRISSWYYPCSESWDFHAR